MEDTLLVELLTEELPPRALRRMSQAFSEALLEGLVQDALASGDSVATSYATPRRLAVSITHVLDKAQDHPVEIPGPSIKVGLGADGKPTQALIGFARKNGVTVDELVHIETAKGKVFACRILATGARLDNTLDLKVQDALRRVPIPKVMRWGNGNAQFVRPVHGLVMMHGTRIVPGEVLGTSSINQTLGHRFLRRGPITIKNTNDYEKTLLEEGKVIASFDCRRSKIVNNINAMSGLSAAAVANDALFDEIAALVEWPSVCEGKFSAEFLDVPQECLVLSMQQHQKYVPLRDKASGKLLPRFLFVSNLTPDDASNVIHGNERVLRARLSDAKFFYDQDRKTRLETRVPKLASVVYVKRLGSQLERVERIQLLTGKIARQLGADVLLAERAAWLSKADLLTGMVGEFPELQGIMGHYYALHDGEPKEVAEAIEVHYRPRFAGDALPDGNLAASVALADKLDALAGLFGIGQAPTGDKDPFGLRRAALGVVRILIECDLPLALDELVRAGFAGFGSRIGDAQTDVETFIYDRLSGYLKDMDYSTLEVESVVSLRPVKVYLVPLQLRAVRSFNKLPESQSLAAANKRVANILRQAAAKGESFVNAAPDLLKEAAERQLYAALRTISEQATALFNQGDFTGYLKSYAALKTPVDAFFDSVMVMADAPELRRNRLALLADLRREMNRVADISKLAA